MVNCAHHSLKCQCEESDICGSFSANLIIDREVFYVHLHPLLSDFFLFSVSRVCRLLLSFFSSAGGTFGLVEFMPFGCSALIRSFKSAGHKL
jgi:hypothetical protein